ncbi:MAG: hypothetical protein ABIR04_11725 [Cypionkella sp.]
MGSDLRFTIRRAGPDGAEIQFDDEEILTPSGAPVAWEFRTLNNTDRYYWHRSDWPADPCINMMQRCEEPMPMS